MPWQPIALAVAFAAPAMAQNSATAQAPLSAPTPGPAPANAFPRVKFSLDGRMEGPSAMFFLPLERGYFKAAGI